MFALIDLIVRLVTDVGRFLDVFVNDLILGAGDPLTVVAILFGQAFLGIAVIVFGYTVIGALFDEIGVKLPSFGGRGRTE